MRPVEVEVLGSFYRIDPDLPALLAHELSGTGETIEAIARDLGGISLTISAAGLHIAASVNPANDIQRLLGGAGTLPPLPSGISGQRCWTRGHSTASSCLQDWHRSDTDADSGRRS